MIPIFVSGDPSMTCVGLVYQLQAPANCANAKLLSWHVVPAALPFGVSEDDVDFLFPNSLITGFKVPKAGRYWVYVRCCE